MKDNEILRCPKCQKTKISTIVYGMSAMTKELMNKVEKGEIFLAGCIVEDSAPRYICRWCKNKF